MKKHTCQICRHSFQSEIPPKVCPQCKQDFIELELDFGDSDIEFDFDESEQDSLDFELPEDESSLKDSGTLRIDFDFDEDDDELPEATSAETPSSDSDSAEFRLTGLGDDNEDNETARISDDELDLELPDPEITLNSDDENEIELTEAVSDPSSDALDFNSFESEVDASAHDDDDESLQEPRTTVDYIDQTVPTPRKTINDRERKQTISDQPSSVEFDFEDTDPLATLGAGPKKGIASSSNSNDLPEDTLRLEGSSGVGSSDDDFDIHEADTLFDVTQPGQDSLDPTLKTPREETDNTIVNPNAAVEAAQDYSKGLDTIIPPRAVSRMDETGKLQEYKVEKRLGSGAFGVVFQATQVPLDRKVAVKVLQVDHEAPSSRKEKLRNEFLREAQFTGRLEHPNIVPIHDIGLTINPSGAVNPFYVMKEIRGESWLSSIRDNSRRQNLDIFKRVLNAISFAHDKGILHCDLKPDNVMLGEFGEVLVVDWGQAVDLNKPETMRPGGTPAYISPEMARYWCDIYLDRKEDSPSREEVGRRSDVYLLGALLFEIITGSPPHLTKDATPYEVIRLAADNKIRNYAKFENDELMQIALAVLRVEGFESIETCDEFMSAINAYENRRISIDLRNRAFEILAEAQQSGDYDEYQRSRFGFEESLEKWPENKESLRGLRLAQVTCAQQALQDQNFDLGIGMLPSPQNEEEQNLKSKLISGKKKRDQRKKLVRYLALGLAASILVGIGLNAFMINENLKTGRLRDIALVEKAEAEEAKAELENQVEPLRQEIASNKQQIEEFPKKLQQERKNFEDQLAIEKSKLDDQLEAQEKMQIARLAEQQQRHQVDLDKEKEQFESELNDQKRVFETQLVEEKRQFNQQLMVEQQKFEGQKKDLIRQKNELNRQVANLNESSRLLRYKSRLTNVAQKLQSGDYQQTRTLLDEFDDSTTWEWQRLNLLSHREIKAVYPNEELLDVTASNDGSRLGFAFSDRVEVRGSSDLSAPLVQIPVVGATQVAISNDGNTLAIAKPAESKISPGTIWLLDISTVHQPTEIAQLEAQSISISGLEFASDSKSLLSVGIPSPYRKSAGLKEKELMVWDQNGEQIDVKLIVGQGSLPKFNQARFSANGNRILTYQDDGLPSEQFAHVFELKNNVYRWQATSPQSGVNVSTFADQKGDAVIACVRDSRNGTYSLVSWNAFAPKESGTQFISTNTAAQNPFVVVSQLEDKALCLNKNGNWLLTSGLDKKATLWDWSSRSQKQFGGHARDIEFCKVIAGESADDHVLLTASLGNTPELLQNDLSKYRDEFSIEEMGTIPPSVQPSPTSFAMDQGSQTQIFGNDSGQVAIRSQTEKIQWNVSAWKLHSVSDEFLFAKSGDDYFYQYNIQNGSLVGVLTGPASLPGTILRFEPSKDASIALVITDDERPEFHLWDLQNDELIRTINFGQEDVFGTGSDKELLKLTLSPDGKWIIGSKIGLFAWNVATGARKSLSSNELEHSRSPVNSIVFLEGQNQFLANSKDRVDWFDLEGGNAPKRFNTSRIFYNKSEPSLLDARLVQGQLQVLARAAKGGGVVLMDLASNTIVRQFPQAVSAAFGKGPNREQVVVANRSGHQPPAELWDSGVTTPLSISGPLKSRFGDRFDAIKRITQQPDGTILLQSSVRNRLNSIQRDWNTVSVVARDQIGPLRVIAKPNIESVSFRENQAFTLDSGKIRKWKIQGSAVSPAGIIPGDFVDAKLSRDKNVLLTIEDGTNSVVGISPETGKEIFRQRIQPFPTAIAWMNVDGLFVSGDSTGTLTLWHINLGSGELSRISTFAASTEPIKEIVSAIGTDTVAAITQTGTTALVIHNVSSTPQRVVIRHVDGQKITRGVLTENGERFLSGSTQGRLTIWNCEANGNANELESDPATSERELLTLANKHQSPITIAELIQVDGRQQLITAEQDSGENQYILWNIEPEN